MSQVWSVVILGFFTYALCFMATIFGVGEDGKLPSLKDISAERNVAILMHGFFWLLIAIFATIIYRNGSIDEVVLPVVLAGLMFEGLLFIPNGLDHKKWRIILWGVGLFGALVGMIGIYYDV